jgi:hypothetical protein
LTYVWPLTLDSYQQIPHLQFFASELGMNHMMLSLVVQLSLAFGVAGLLWPEKLVAVFDVLMFPWPATHRFVRSHAWGAILLSLLLFLSLIVRR